LIRPPWNVDAVQWQVVSSAGGQQSRIRGRGSAVFSTATITYVGVALSVRTGSSLLHTARMSMSDCLSVSLSLFHTLSLVFANPDIRYYLSGYPDLSANFVASENPDILIFEVKIRIFRMYENSE